MMCNSKAEDMTIEIDYIHMSYESKKSDIKFCGYGSYMCISNYYFSVDIHITLMPLTFGTQNLFSTDDVSVLPTLL